MPITWSTTTVPSDDLISRVIQTTATISTTANTRYAPATDWTISFADQQWVKEIIEAYQESGSPPDKRDFLEMLE